jgi:hypothetical protein
MRIQVIQHDPVIIRFWMTFIDQPLHLMGEVLHGIPFGQADLPLGDQGFEEHMQVANSMALLLIIVALHLPGLGRQDDLGFYNQLFQPFIVADQRAFGIIGLFVQVQHVFHAGYIRCVGLGDAPHSYSN